MGNIKGSLEKKIKQLGIERQVEAAGVVEAAQKEIAKFVPEEDFEVVSFKKGQLKIKTKSATTSSEIMLINRRILKLNNKIRNIKITSD